jgi:5-methylthioadenosine/S-adenosylhomocysteine deaminase
MNCEPSNMLLLKGGRILTMDEKDRIFDPGYVLIQNQLIAALGDLDDLDPLIREKARTIDVRDKLIMPGLINSHTHSCMSILRGLAEDAPRGSWLEEKIQPLEARLTGEDYYWSSRLGCLEMIRNGITCIADRGPYLENLARAVEESGIRAVLSLTLNDRQGINGLKRALEFASAWQGSDRITFGLGPHATDTCSRELLCKIKEAAVANEFRIFVHVAQSEKEIQAVNSKGYPGAIAYLDDLNFLDSRVVAAHCIYITAKEIDILARTGTWVAHCPSSNLKIEAKTTPLARLISNGVHWCIATDSAACNNGMDLLAEMKIAALLHKQAEQNPQSMRVSTLLPAVTASASLALGLQDEIGSIAVGKRADLISIKMKQPALQPWYDDHSQLVYAASGGNVTDVLIDGEFRLRNGNFVKADDLRIMAEVIGRSKKLSSH